VIFFAILRCDTHFKMNGVKMTGDIYHDNLHMKFSALNVDFNSQSLDPL